VNDMVLDEEDELEPEEVLRLNNEDADQPEFN
jgi:hypothetical protein